MNYNKYEIHTSTNNDVYTFTSSGHNGEIEKIIEFSKTQNDSIYNLAFGDKSIVYINGKPKETIDDLNESKNGDLDKILATVAMAVYEYTSIFPNRQIFFVGSDERRTRLYRMAITKNYNELNNDFIIFGVIYNNTQLTTIEFCSKTNCLGYIIKRRPLLNEIS